jgi:preprotein translocase subunit Sss1
MYNRQSLFVNNRYWTLLPSVLPAKFIRFVVLRFPHLKKMTSENSTAGVALFGLATCVGFVIALIASIWAGLEYFDKDNDNALGWFVAGCVGMVVAILLPLVALVCAHICNKRQPQLHY